MSAVHIGEVKNELSPDQLTVRKMLEENAQLIDTIAEYQRMGRIEEATKYQELLHRNIIYLGKLTRRAES